MAALHVVLVILIVAMIVVLVVTSPKDAKKESHSTAAPEPAERDALEPLPADPSDLVDVECHDKLAVYKHELEFHVLMDPEKIWNTRFKVPKSWLELDEGELLQKLSRGIDAVYVEHRREWNEGGDLNYPVLIRARFRVRSRSEPLEQNESIKLHELG